MWQIQLRTHCDRVFTGGFLLTADRWQTVEQFADYATARAVADQYYEGTGLWACRVRFARSES